MKVTDATFESEVLKYEGEVLVDFYADWCGPCKMLSPIIEEIANERTDVKVVKVNIDECPNTAAKYNVMSIPTLIVFNNGAVKNQALGYMPKANVLNLL